MAHRPRISDRMYEAAVDVKEEYGLSSINEAIRHMARSGDEYDV